MLFILYENKLVPSKQGDNEESSSGISVKEFVSLFKAPDAVSWRKKKQNMKGM